MDETKTQTPGADVTPEGGGDAQPSEGDLKSSESITLEEVNKQTGKDFKSLEEFWKADKEKEGFIGGLGEVKDKAQKWDEAEAGKTITPQEKIKEEYSPGGRIDRIEFNQKFPGTGAVVEEIASIAKARGKSMAEVYPDSYLEKSVEKERKEQEAASPGVMTPGAKLPPGQLSMSVEDFNKLPLEEQRKIVEKLPQWTEKISEMGSFKSSKRTG